MFVVCFFFFSSRRRHTRCGRDWSSDVCSSDLPPFDAVMSGLDNPRGLAWGPEGALYVAEAGRGGTQPCFATPRGPAFAGFTGAVSRLWHGAQERVATGFPSYTENAPSGIAATGPHDIALLGRGDARVSIGLGNNPAL